MTDQKTDLLPCPFCGSTDVVARGDDKIIGVCCNNCEAHGPNQYGSFEWEDRADLAPKVKPLEFSDEGYAYNGLGSMYHITFHNDLSKGWILYRWESGEQTRIGSHEDYDELAEIADKDNRGRILSALTPAPITPAQAAKVFMELGRQNYLEDTDASEAMGQNVASWEDVPGHIRRQYAASALKAIAEEGE